MFDFSALEKAQAAVHTVGHGHVEKRGFNYPALRVGAVEHGDFLAVHAVAYELLHLVDHPLRFGKIAGCLVNAHRLTRALLGAQVLAQAAAVVADERVGRIEDIAVAAVVLLQLDLVPHVELAHKVGHIADPRTAKGINALVVVTHGQNGPAVGRVAALHAFACQHLDPGVLQFVGVLKLVDQNVPEAPLVVLANRRVVAQ